MKQSRADSLLRELFGLYSKYGQSEFEKAIKKLESGTSLGTLLRSIESVKSVALGSISERSPSSVAVGQDRSLSKRKTPHDRLTDFLDNLSKHATPEHETLRNFVSAIAERKLLPNAATLREYSKIIGIPQDTKTDRRLMARKIGEILLSEPGETRKDHIERGIKLGNERSSLEAWSEVIVKDHK